LLFNNDGGNAMEEEYIQNIFNCNDKKNKNANGEIEREGGFRLDFEIERCYDLVE
jgi:hypothetical protein